MNEELKEQMAFIMLERLWIKGLITDEEFSKAKKIVSEKINVKKCILPPDETIHSAV